MKLKTIFAAAILAVGAISLPSLAITTTVSSTGGPWAYTTMFGCSWQVTYSNGGTGYDMANYKPVGACQYQSMYYSHYWTNNYATLTAN